MELGKVLLKKPDPTLAIHIAEKLGIPNEECIFIGDTPTDMQTALKAGMFPIGVLWGFRTKKYYQKPGLNYFVNPRGKFIIL